jgi:hypothetical protein
MIGILLPPDRITMPMNHKIVSKREISYINDPIQRTVNSPNQSHQRQEEEEELTLSEAPQPET